jgi:hypothetical protein
MAGVLEQSGGQPQKQPHYAPIFEDRMFTGLYTQRSVLHDPSDVYTARFYGGRPDALLGGRNIELTNRLTLQRRPGMVPFGCPTSGTTYPTPPDRAFSFQLSNGEIQVIIDTESSGDLAITSADDASAGTTVYNGTFPGGANNGYLGLTFLISGFTVNPPNNGAFTVVASTLTTLTLSNKQGVAETRAAIAITAGGIYLDNQNCTKTLLFAKSPGAGQAYFIGVGGVLYFGDGVDTKKYTPLNPNGTIWDWGIVAPTSQPNITVTQSGAAASVWQASTVFSTMGLTLDTNSPSQIWQVIGINAAGTNTNPTFGTTGTGEPNWPTTEGATIVDGSVTWTNAGALNDWSANTFFTDIGYFGHSPGPSFADPAAIAVASVSTLYGNFKNSGFLGSTGPANDEPHFSGAYPGPSGGYFDNGTHWFAIGSYSTPARLATLRWKPSTTYMGWQSGGDTATVAGTPQLVITNNLPAATGTTVYLMIPTTGGTSSTGYTPFIANSAVGATVTDGDITWMCLGPSAWAANHAYTPWTTQGLIFGCVWDGTNFQVCTKITGSGLSGGSTPAWSTGYGSTTIDGGVTWTCVGKNVSWAAAQTWNFPTVGFQPPSQSETFGGSEVNGGGDVQAVIESGTSGGSQPSWSTTTSTPPTTSDGSITWQAVGATTTNSLVSSFGWAYAYSYKARPIDDFYSPLPLGGGAVPPGSVVLGPPLGSETDVISSASPVNQIIGANSGAVNTITGNYSPDPQVDTIIIWRSADSASGGGNMFELTEIPNIPALAGVKMWSFQDFLPSVATGTYPGLNVLLPAPIDGVNNPPLSTFLPQVFNYQRIWGSNGQQVNFSGGPDTNVGNPNEAFNVSDELPFLAPVIRLIKTPQGIVTFLTDSIEMIGGGPATATFFSVTMAPGIGLLSYNACDVFAGEIYFFSSDNMFRVISPGLNVSNFGFALGDQFANQPSFGASDTIWNPANVYVAVHQNGTDNCIFVADGSTGWYRLNPHQIPGGSQGPEPIWSPFAAITGGCQMVQSVEVSPGIKKLLAGGTQPAQIILERDLEIFTDNGAMYDAYFTMGSITLVHPGELAILKFLEFDFSGKQFQPTISYLLNEISGTFTPFVNNMNGVPQFDPPSLYGETIIPQSYSPNRYYFNSNADVARCRHMQVNVDYGETAVGDEVYTMTIYGRKVVEL